MPDGWMFRDGCISRLRCHRLQLTAKRKQGVAESVRKKSVVTDSNESLGQNMEEEPAQELRSAVSCSAVCIGGRSPSIGEGDAFSVERKESMVGYGDPVCVTTQVTKDLSRAAECRFRIHNAYRPPRQRVRSCRLLGSRLEISTLKSRSAKLSTPSYKAQTAYPALSSATSGADSRFANTEAGVCPPSTDGTVRP